MLAQSRPSGALVAPRYLDARSFDLRGFQPGRTIENAIQAERLFAQRQQPANQIAAADVDNDGDEDTTALRLCPLTGVAGQSFAAGATADLTPEIKPLKLFQAWNFVVDEVLARSFVITSFFVGQDDLLVAKGGIPLSGLVGQAVDNLLDAPWAGPGISIYLTLKNISADVVVFYGGLRGKAVVG